MKTIFPLSVLAFAIARFRSPRKPPSRPPPSRCAKDRQPARRAAAAKSPQRPRAACAKLPELSPKVPALPAGLPCAKPLYTITTSPHRQTQRRLSHGRPRPARCPRHSVPSTFTLSYIDTKVGTGALASPRESGTPSNTPATSSMAPSSTPPTTIPTTPPSPSSKSTGPQGQRQVVRRNGHRPRRNARRRQAPPLHPLAARLRPQPLQKHPAKVLAHLRR